MSHTILVTETGAVPDSPELQTAAFQAAFDLAFEAGGATVVVPRGKYTIGAVRIRSNTTLLLKSGAYIYGSRDPEEYYVLQNDTLEPLPEEYRTDMPYWNYRKGEVKNDSHVYMKPGGRWNNGLIRAFGAENIAVVGEKDAVIDGCNPFDELGEEYYRGPHGISMHYCKNITFSGYTAQHMGNWAHNIWYSQNIVCDGVTVLGGHDGFHMRSCTNVTIRHAQFYCGDDCVAGYGNVNVLVHDCIMNTSCSGLRFGGTNALIRNCRFYGPAVYFIRGSLTPQEKREGASSVNDPVRFNMLSVFTYFAGNTNDIPEQPGNIILKDCSVEHVDRLIHYNFSGNERWQLHRPLKDLTLENIRATEIGMPLTAYGSADTPLSLTLKNVDVGFSEKDREFPFLCIANCERLVMDHVNVRKKSSGGFIRSWTPLPNVEFNQVEFNAPREEWIEYTNETFSCKTV